MPSYQTSILIDAPREHVWTIMVNVPAWPEFLPTVSRVEVLDAAILRTGHRYRLHQPGLRPSVWTVSALERSRRFTWQSRRTGLLMEGDHAVEDTAASQCRVTLRMSFRGLRGGPAGWLFGRLTQRYIETEAAAFKFMAESAGPSGLPSS